MLETAARYVAAASLAVAGTVVLAVGAVHLLAGVPTALLPTVGGLAAIGAGVAVTPAVRGSLRSEAGARADVVLTTATLVGATLSLFAFVALASLS